MPASVVNCSAEVFVEYLGDRLDMFLEACCCSGSWLGGTIDYSILPDRTRPRKGDMLP